MIRLVLFSLLVASAFSRLAYQFSDGVDQILSAPVKTTFSCDNLPYGYYADVDNNCEIFHICLPIQDDNGDTIETHHFSFACGNTTVFNQESLTCSHPEDSIPCSESKALYDVVNSEFGRVPERK